MNEKQCPFCGAGIFLQNNVSIQFQCWSWIGTTKEDGRVIQSMTCLKRQRNQLQADLVREEKCLQRQRDQLQARLQKAEGLLRNWLECFPREFLHDQVSCQETADFLVEQEPLGKEFEQILHDNMDNLRVKT